MVRKSEEWWSVQPSSLHTSLRHPQLPSPSKRTEPELASLFAGNQEAPPCKVTRLVIFFFPPKHCFLDLKVNECKVKVSRVTCFLESFFPHHQVTSCTTPQSPSRLAWTSRKVGSICGKESPLTLLCLSFSFPEREHVSAHGPAHAFSGSLRYGMHGPQEWRELIVIAQVCPQSPPTCPRTPHVAHGLP